jgi:hypothetical protein
MPVVSNTSPILNLAILLRARQLGELGSLQPVIDDLINKAGFRIAPELLAQILTH